MAGEAQSGWLKREAVIVGGGAADAMAKGFSDAYQALPTLKEVSDRLSNPVETAFDGLYAAGNYALNHKLDFAMGAAISFISPRSMLHAGLLAWSAHGLVGSLGSATSRACDSSYDVNQARHQFKNDLLHEGQAFVGALPMILAGGIAGRGVANGIFGWDKSLSDFRWRSLSERPKTALSPELGFEFHYGTVAFSPHPYNPKIRKLSFEPKPEFVAKVQAAKAAKADATDTTNPTNKIDKIDFQLPKANDGSVSWQDVLANTDAWRMKKLLIHDLDNAAYKFPEGILGRNVATDNVPGEGIQKAISMIHQKLAARGVNITEQEIGIKLGKTMNANRTHDGAWQIQQSPLYEMYGGTPKEFEANIVEPFWKIIDKSRQDYLKAFDGVHEVLAEFTAKGGKVAALSDAPLEVSIPGLRITKLDPYIKRLASMQALEPAPGTIDPIALESGRNRVRTKLNEPTQVEDIIELPRDPGHDPLYNLEKPHAAGIDTLVAIENVRPSQAVVFDDSRVKGGGAAQNASGGPIDFIWFEGQKHAFNPVHAILDPHALKTAAKSGQPGYKASVQSYAELRQYLYPQYKELFRGVLQAPRLTSVLGYNTVGQDKDK